VSEGRAPKALGAVLETSLYHEAGDTAALEGFYTEVLGLPIVSRWPGGVALRVGASVLLLFERETVAQREDPISDHGTAGPGHACLLAGDPESYEEWRGRIAAAGVEVTHEHEWKGGRRSFYFKDPAGNLLEIADGDIWPPA
jgi:catechol 2,3-dioxygenase-like lactoylglutathione lyase family enzyme